MNTRQCPRCNVSMDFRLGEFECPNCGHNELAVPPKSEATHEPSGPGFKRSQQWQGGVQPPVPPPAARSESQGAGFGSYYAPAPETYERFDDTLQTEKNVYFGIQVVGSIIGLFVIANAGPALFGALEQDPDFASTPGMPPAGVFSGAMIGMAIFFSLISLGLIAFVLYGKAIWAKWTCLGCTGISLMFMFFGLFGILAGGGASIIQGLFQFALGIWLVSILYRDIQNLSGGYS